MWFPKYWEKESASGIGSDGKSLEVFCWGFSDQGADDARSEAKRSAEKVLERMRKDEEGLDRYGYPDRPVREEVLEEFHSQSPEYFSVISRNAYGCKVLNTQGLMFVDVDFPARKRGFLASLFGGNKDREIEGATLEKIRTWMKMHPHWGMRVYRTKNGFRLLSTHATFDPASEQTHSLMNELGVDPLYARLCKNQKSFRARLTPKPWRIGVKPPPARYPFDGPAHRADFEKWEALYRQKSEGYSTCHLLEKIGSDDLASPLKAVVELHDRWTRALDRAPLA